MPHIAITMHPGRDRQIKASLAEKVRKLIAEEMHLDEMVVSVSVADVAKEDWVAHLKSFDPETVFYMKKLDD